MKQKVLDIASIAGVSSATVSNALNGRKGVSEKTKQKIWKIARDIGYSREPANSSVQKAIRLVVFKRHGYVVSDTPFFASVIEGMERECRLLGYEMLVSHVNTKEAGQNAADSANFAGSSGILLLATEMGPGDLQQFGNSGIPVVLLDSNFREQDFDLVLTNSVDAAYKATAYLAENGHTRIGHLRSSIPINNFTDRRRGHLQALEDHGLDGDPGLEILLEPTIEGSYRDMRKALERPGGYLPTAFFADNDIIAFGAMRALKEKGVRIPSDISIIGFDDMPFCEVTSPRLTTIKVFKQEMGSAAVKRLKQILEAQNHVRQKIELGTELVIRDSVANISK